MSPFWILLELKMMQAVVTTGAIRHAKLQQANTKLFTGQTPFLPPNHQCRSTGGKLGDQNDW